MFFFFPSLFPILWALRLMVGCPPSRTPRQLPSAPPKPPKPPAQRPLSSLTVGGCCKCVPHWLEKPEKPPLHLAPGTTPNWQGSTAHQAPWQGTCPRIPSPYLQPAATYCTPSLPRPYQCLPVPSHPFLYVRTTTLVPPVSTFFISPQSSLVLLLSRLLHSCSLFLTFDIFSTGIGSAHVSPRRLAFPASQS